MSAQQPLKGRDFVAGVVVPRLPHPVEPDAHQAGRRRTFSIQHPVVTDVQGLRGKGAKEADAFEVDRRFRLGHVDLERSAERPVPTRRLILSRPAPSSFARW